MNYAYHKNKRNKVARMKKLPMIIAVGTLVVIAGAAAVVVTMNSNSTSKNSSAAQKDTRVYKQIVACSLLTLDDAKGLLGASAVKSAPNDQNNTQSVKADTCTYVAAGTTLQTTKGTSVIVRSPLNTDGVAENKQSFDSQKSKSSQTVAGYGEAAYYTPEYSQLNVYKDGYWYTVSNGSAFRPQSNTLAEAKLAADKVFK